MEWSCSETQQTQHMDLPEVVTVKVTLFSASQGDRVMIEMDTSGERSELQLGSVSETLLEQQWNK